MSNLIKYISFIPVIIIIIISYFRIKINKSFDTFNYYLYLQNSLANYCEEHRCKKKKQCSDIVSILF